jgi:hypothetical protein
VEDLERMRKLELYATRMMQSITRLSNIASVHDIQINDHEHRIGDMEAKN